MTIVFKNWKEYLTKPNKIQFINAGLTKAFDTSFCVTFSFLKAIQDLINFKIENGLISLELIAWLSANKYLNAQRQVDFSPRFTGTMGHTTIYGNTQWNIINCIYAYGLIPETTHPNIADSWEEYADEKKITQEMKDLGMEFLKRFKIEIEDAVLSDLEISPLQAIVRFADGDGILSPEGKTNHGVVIYYREDNCVDISDSYWQEFKKYALNKVFFLQKIIINEKNTMQDELNKFIVENDLKWVRNSQNGAFGRILHGKLMQINSTDRGALALLDDKVRKEGININNEMWYKLPLGNF